MWYNKSVLKRKEFIKMFEKGKVQEVEFGDYGNFASLIQLSVKPWTYDNDKNLSVIEFAFEKGDMPNVNLVISNDEINFESFT